MEQGFIVFYFCAVLVGVFALGSFVALLRNDENEIIKAYLTSYLIFTLLIISILLRNYQYLLFHQKSLAVIILQFLGITFTVYMLTYLANKIFLVPFAKMADRIWFGYTIVILMLSVCKELFGNQLQQIPLLRAFEDEWAYLPMLGYIVIVYLKYRKRIGDKKITRILNFVFWTTVLFLPGIFFDEYGQPDGIKGIFTPLLFMVISIFALVSLFKYSTTIQSTKFEVSVDFKKQYGITDREAEVLLLLVKGYSYNKIAAELVISLSTVRTHVMNLYKKAGVNSRYELLNRLG